MTHDLGKYNTRELKRELLARVMLQEYPTITLVAELARRQEGSVGRGNIVHKRFREFCAQAFDLTVPMLMGQRKPKHIAAARAVSMTVAFDVLEGTMTDIANLFGRKDHSSCFHAKVRVSKSNELRQSAIDLKHRWQQRQKSEARLFQTEQ